MAKPAKAKKKSSASSSKKPSAKAKPNKAVKAKAKPAPKKKPASKSKTVSKSKPPAKKKPSPRPEPPKKKQAAKKKASAVKAKAAVPSKPVAKTKPAASPGKPETKASPVASRPAKPSPKVAAKTGKDEKGKGRGKGKEPVKKKKVTLKSILEQPRAPIFVKKAELPKIVYPVITSNKKQFKIEYPMRSSPHLLYNYLSTASGLSAWFANDVNIRDGQYTFFWNGSTAKARVIASREDLLIAYQWVDETDNSYFVFEIVQDDITGDVALIVTDFAPPAEVEQNRLLWNSQIHALAQVIGS